MSSKIQLEGSQPSQSRETLQLEFIESPKPKRSPSPSELKYKRIAEHYPEPEISLGIGRLSVKHELKPLSPSYKIKLDDVRTLLKGLVYPAVEEVDKLQCILTNVRIEVHSSMKEPKSRKTSKDILCEEIKDYLKGFISKNLSKLIDKNEFESLLYLELILEHSKPRNPMIECPVQPIHKQAKPTQKIKKVMDNSSPLQPVSEREKEKRHHPELINSISHNLQGPTIRERSRTAEKRGFITRNIFKIGNVQTLNNYGYDGSHFVKKSEH